MVVVVCHQQMQPMTYARTWKPPRLLTQTEGAAD
jgi:hypothetical protein